MHRHVRKTAASARRGVVLIVVLVLVVMISLAGFAFMNRMATEYEATLVSGDLQQAVQTLASAETFLVSLAEQQAADPEPRSLFRHDVHLFSARTVNPARVPDSDPSAARATVARSHRWRFSVVHRLPDPVDQSGLGVTDFESGESTIRFGMNNESGKLHLGLVMMQDQEVEGSGREVLMQIPGMTPEAADSILDWIDSDSRPREFGAESEYYAQLNQPFEPRNGLPQSLEELLFVKGVSREAFYGRAAADPAQVTGDTSWPALLTVHSAEPNRDRHGDPRLDLNELYPSEYGGLSGSSGELSFLPPELVKYILLLRLYGVSYPPESSSGQTAAAGSSTASASSALTGFQLPGDPSVDLVEIDSLADLFDSSVQLPQSQGGQLINSPLQSSSPDFAEMMRLIEDRLTVDIDEVQIGRININTAPQPVLKSLFDDAETVLQIIQQRDSVDSWERESTVWLLTRRILDLQTYRRIYPHITTRGAVHSGEIVVYREFGGPYLRRRLIIDASGEKAQRVAWTDLTERGLPIRTSDLRYQGLETGIQETFDMLDEADPLDELR